MRSFLFGLLAAALLWWGGKAWLADPSHASDPVGDRAQPGLEQVVQEAGGPPPAEPEALSEPEMPPLDSGQSPGAQAAALAEGVRQGDRQSWQQALVRLARKGEHGVEERIAQAVLESQAETAAEAVARLGTNNAFLHSASGRKAAREALSLAAAEPDPKAVELLTRMVELCMRGDLGKDDREANALIDEIYAEQQKPVLRHVCDPTNLTRAHSYKVARGDSLSAIASRFRRKEALQLEAGTLALVNRIHNVNAVRIGQELKIPTDPIVTVMEKRSFLMAVYLGDAILRLYRVGHGEDGKTPATEFRVVEKLSNPDWYAPDGNVYPFGHPKNILGKYFVKLEHPSFQGFGVHGTNQPETIGTEASMGCLRMLDDDIEEYFRIVPRGSKLIVRESR